MASPPADEATPLLDPTIGDDSAPRPPSSPSSTAPSQISTSPPANYTRRAIIVCLILLCVLELGIYLQGPPLVELAEITICRNLYGSVAENGGDGGGGGRNPCKGDDVQGQLAMLRGWQAAFESVPPILASIPYGIVADKYGRRLVLFLSTLGVVLCLGWQMVPLIWPDALPIWTQWFASLFLFIGGGPQMLIAMLWTIVADVIPAERRTPVVYQFSAVALAGELVVNPLAAFLMSINPWLPMWLGFGVQVFGVCVAPIVPETLELRRAADDRIREQLAAAEVEVEIDSDAEDENGETSPLVNGRANEVVQDDTGSVKTGDDRAFLDSLWYSIRNDVSHVWRFIFASKGVSALLVGFTISTLVRLARISLILQYVTKRYDWKYSEATYLLTIGSVTNLVLLLVLLPAISRFLTAKFNIPPLTRDLLLCRSSGLVLVVGSLLISLAFAPPLIIVALIIFSLGLGFIPLCRSLLLAVVEPHTVAALNTTIALLEQVGQLVSAPLLSALLKEGIKAGGGWIGLPYLAATVLAAVAVAIVFMYRLPARTGASASV